MASQAAKLVKRWSKPRRRYDDGADTGASESDLRYKNSRKRLLEVARKRVRKLMRQRVQWRRVDGYLVQWARVIGMALCLDLREIQKLLEFPKWQGVNASLVALILYLSFFKWMDSPRWVWLAFKLHLLLCIITGALMLWNHFKPKHARDAAQVFAEIGIYVVGWALFVWSVTMLTLLGFVWLMPRSLLGILIKLCSIGVVVIGSCTFLVSDGAKRLHLELLKRGMKYDEGFHKVRALKNSDKVADFVLAVSVEDFLQLGGLIPYEEALERGILQRFKLNQPDLWKHRLMFVSHKWFGHNPDYKNRFYNLVAEHVSNQSGKDLLWIDNCCVPPAQLASVIRTIPEIIKHATFVRLTPKNIGYEDSFWCVAESLLSLGFAKDDSKIDLEGFTLVGQSHPLYYREEEDRIILGDVLVDLIDFQPSGDLSALGINVMLFLERAQTVKIETSSDMQ